MLRSVDIFDGTVITDWSKLKGQVEAVYIKATEGKTYVNPRLNEQYQNAKAQGLMVGFYHFARRNAALEEYSHFKDTIADFKQDLKPVLDYEVEGEQDYNYINQFLGQDSNLILYGSHSTLDNTHLPENKLWVAEPETSPLNTRGYAGIQYTWKGSIEGIKGDCDIDIFGSVVVVGGIPQDTPISTVVRALQHNLNRLFNSDLVEDNIPGPLTNAAIENYGQIIGTTDINALLEATNQVLSFPVLRFGSKGAAVRYVQYRLGIQPLDGDYGIITQSSIHKYEVSKGLTLDIGIVGNEIWNELMK